MTCASRWWPTGGSTSRCTPWRGSGSGGCGGRAVATVAFAPQVPPAEAFAAAGAAGKGVVWTDEAAGVFVVAALGPRAAAGLYQRSALFVGGAGLPAGCLASTREG